MAITIGGYEFQGPHTSIDELRPEPGICALVAERNGRVDVIEIVDLNNVRTVLDDDEYTGNMRFWTETHYGTLAVAVFYTSGMPTVDRVSLKRMLAAEIALEQAARRRRSA
jgi:hypothetical protein